MYISVNCHTYRRQPYFCCFLAPRAIGESNRISTCNSRRKYYNQSIFYKLRCDNLNNKQIKFSIRRYFYQDLGTLQNEIQLLSEDVHSKILKSLDVNKNIIRENYKSISKLIRLQQKLLSLSASKYGIYDIRTTKLANNYLCSLVFRIHAVSELFKTSGFKSSGVDGVILRRIDYYKWVKYLSYSNVFRRKFGLIKRVFIPKPNGNKCSLGIAILADRLIQMLFIITYEPIVETVSDVYSFGFRKNQNTHQALGVLFNKLHGLYGKPQSFYAPKYVLNYDIKGFFGFLNYNWLIRMFPAHHKHKFLIHAWLNVSISFKEVVRSNPESFLQRSVIGPLLANFTLNGLENIIKPEKGVYKNETKLK